MQATDLEDLVGRLTKGGKKERDVREALETVRQVESLGGTKAQYNIAPPFGSLKRRATGSKSQKLVKLTVRP